MATDPVCGMFVDETTSSLRLVRENRTYHFCSAGCLRTFANPEAERRELRVRLAIAWPLSVVIVVLTYGLATPPALWACAVLAAIVQFYPGSVFYVGARDAVRQRTGNMDFLIAVGTSAAFAYSLATLVVPGRLPPGAYFDASALIVTLILTGNYLERLTRARAGSALLRLGELLPSQARVVRDGEERSIAVSEVVPGDRVRVAPGGRFPADGIVRAGRTSVDESILTGEPLPLGRQAGDRVLAGSMNVEGAVEVEATEAGEDTFLAQVGRLLADAEASRLPLRRTADRIASVFVPVVLTLAIAASLFWGVAEHAGIAVSVLVFVTVAITACPCAFGIATPAAILVGTGRAAEEGVLFRGEDAIERTARVDLVLTDKTGTLTTLTPEVASVGAVPPFSVDEVASAASGLETGADHPLARSVVSWARGRGVSPTRFDEVQVDPGRGVRGRSGSRRFALVRGDAAEAEGTDLTPLRDWIRLAEENGDSWSVLLEDARPRGILSFRVNLAPGVREAVTAVNSAGIEVGIVTGDNERAARRVAGELGVGLVHAGASPARKVEIVEGYGRSGRCVAFVGDGINDAAALAAAGLGIAIGSGTDVAREAGQVLLVRADFAGVPRAIELARRTVSQVRSNLRWAIGYNSVLLPIAAGVLVPLFGIGMYAFLPIAGAVAMGLSSTTVVLASFSLRWGPGGRPAPAATPVSRVATPS